MRTSGEVEYDKRSVNAEILLKKLVLAIDSKWADRKSTPPKELLSALEDAKKWLESRILT